MSDEPIITCSELATGYGERKILEGIEVSIGRSEITAVVGGSGCGKSTLLKTMVGLLKPLAGQVRLLGQDPYALPAEEFRALLRRTGNMFQHGALFSAETVFENLAIPVREHTQLPDEVIWEMARMKLGLVDLHDVMEQSPSQLSGGQKKRVALARAAMLDPEVIFCDEPSAGLDPLAAASLDDTLCRFRDLFQMSVVIITHELPSIERIADRIIMLKDGGIHADGTFDQLQESQDPSVRAFFRRDPTRDGHRVTQTLESVLVSEAES